MGVISAGAHDARTLLLSDISRAIGKRKRKNGKIEDKVKTVWVVFVLRDFGVRSFSIPKYSILKGE